MTKCSQSYLKRKEFNSSGYYNYPREMKVSVRNFLDQAQNKDY